MADGSVIIETKLDTNGVEKGIGKLNSGFGKLGSIAGTALKGTTVAVGAVASAFAGLVTASVSARGEIEQQIGGVITLFKDSADTVIKNAEKAYMTAGMSASQYMETVTSFSASLLQSLGGDTEKAAEVADMALIDMADNANKFGTDMEAIQNAYQGFAKQNYTMLDNLKLGYGGTKTEMERLLKDAQKLTGVKYDINNLSDVYNAIHAVQKELGIAGATGEEALTTLQGSFTAMKASWDNFLSGSGDLTQVVDTAGYVVENIVRIVSEALPSIITNITEALPQILDLGSNVLHQLITGITSNIKLITQTAVDIIKTLAVTILELLPQILEAGMQITIELAKGLAEMLPTLIPQAISCILTLVETWLDNIDMIIDVAIELIIALAEGIIEALPVLIEKIPIIIEKLIQAITNNLPKILQMGITLIIKLAEGLIKAIPQLLSKIPQIIGSLVSSIKDYHSKMGEVGLNLIKGMGQGISNAKDWLIGKIKELCKNSIDAIKNFFGIHSPSRVMQDEVGIFLGQGMGVGFEKSLKSVYRSMQNAVELENAKLTSNLTNSNQIEVQRNENVQATLESIDSDKDITVTAVTNLDGKVLTQTVNKFNAREKLQYGIA